ncbi:MAG TPA: ABC transporter permease subunit [Armatimonadaceae bacterium]|nr:ABC transporter permease subunit [Armatimonadaceae bacterium]
MRTGIGALYAVLILGAVTTLYPFLLMVSTATKSQVDFNDYSPDTLIPRYLRDERPLFTKYAEDRYANNLDDVSAAYNATIDKPQSVLPPGNADDPQVRELADSWAAFQKTLPLDYKKAGFGEHDSAPSALLLRYREHLRAKFGDDIAALNKAWTEENVSFDTVVPPFERTSLREWTPELEKPKVADWTAFKKALPDHYLVTTGADPIYRSFLRQDVYEDDLDALNKAWSASYKDWNEVTLPARLPADGTAAARRADWERFLRTKFPLRMLGVDEAAALPAWRAFLAKRGRAGAATATLPEGVPTSGQAKTDWMDFVSTTLPIASVAANSPENLWRAELAKQGKVDVEAIQPPQAVVDWRYVQANAGALRSDFATRNFRAVFGYVFLHGRAVANTVIFCLLAILSAVIVNPLCAYALSRYPLPYAYKVLLFVLATMAFPAEVAMIPNFLLLRDLGLLNTFWALVLPGLANGFSVFLLKGFFDSLPKELYEAGIIDGATEISMFRRITIPLSMPIFSVIALNAFTASYGAFLFAMVVCQDPKMWTLMVWLYDLQSAAPQYVIMAALTLAALPTLIVFMFAQKVIMRGIILPSFK